MKFWIRKGADGKWYMIAKESYCPLAVRSLSSFSDALQMIYLWEWA